MLQCSAASLVSSLCALPWFISELPMSNLEVLGEAVAAVLDGPRMHD